MRGVDELGNLGGSLTLGLLARLHRIRGRAPVVVVVVGGGGGGGVVVGVPLRFSHF